MTKQEVLQLPEYWGLYFDPTTGMTYREDGTPTGWTFERATWSGPFGLHFAWPFLNPLGFATAETAARVLAICQSAVQTAGYSQVRLTLDDKRRDLGPFTRTVERQIFATNGRTVTDADGQPKPFGESFSAGLLANSIIRNGEAAAMRSWLAELKTARLV